MTIGKRETLEFYLFISPWILGFIIFAAGPIAAVFILSLYSWQIISPAEFIGVENYVSLIQDPLFWQSLKVTLYYVLSVPLRLVAGLAVAVLLNQKIRGVAFFRTVYYLPSVNLGVAVALLWSWIFQPEFGLLNYALSKIGIQGPAWLFSETWVIPSFIIMSLWGMGGAMVIYLAALQGVPTELYEAAELDGAGNWSRFVHITLPMISPVILFNLIIGIINSFQVFVQSYVMTNGGPGNASLFYVLYLYRNAFQYFNMGYACTLAAILFIIILITTILIFRLSAGWVYYEGALRK